METVTGQEALRDERLIATLAAELERLDPAGTPHWGIMSAQQMVEHLAEIVRCSNGGLEVSCVSDPERLPALRRFLVGPKPIAHNVPNPIAGPDPRPLLHPDLEGAREQLRAEIDRYYRFFDEHPDARPVHAVFGPLNGEEWEIFHAKHFRHHLEQFGLISPQ
jgi:oxepin-CoA hydrolase/3-oxo-5,6-dehydrosuberyl-CoA semialdehyde dehydrogenase